MNENGMYQGYSVEGSAKLKFKHDDSEMINHVDECKMMPIYECPTEKCIHKTIIHEVPHVCPINTRIINHHVYKHTYRPCYTCTEENEICNVNENCCNKFM